MSRLHNWTPLPKSWRERAWLDRDAVLLESTLPDPEQHRSLLFTQPHRFLTVTSAAEIPAFFEALEDALAQGYYLAGFLSYELGNLMQGVSTHEMPASVCLAKLGVYPAPAIFEHLRDTDESDAEPGIVQEPLALAMLPVMPREEYLNSVRAVQRWIAQGDTYQVNFTTAVQSHFDDDGLAMYRQLAHEQPCSYAALLHANEHEAVLSFSPELFFRTSSTGQITTRPMKGTAPRCSESTADDEAARALGLDEKNRAEHVMIVDLLRNDLGRICETGSVAVDGLFHVERYPTVHQMVSTVSGQLRANTRWHQVFASLFPSGSITGAPKRRTMELIHQLERAPRGIYTGAIGYIAPSGQSMFSVAIRTVVLRQSAAGAVATMGVGGGIVADSRPEDEWRECLLKASFLQRASVDLRLIETMLIENGAVPRLELHMERLSRSAEALGFCLDADQVRAAVQQRVVQAGQSTRRLRLTCSRMGEIAIQDEALQTWPASLRVRIAPHRMLRGNPALRYKTTFRRWYDDAFSSAKRDGYDEALFLNSEGELTEGCVTNLVLLSKAGWHTPALTCGVLPGVLRESLLRSGQVSETVLHLDRLRNADAVFLGNSVRGLAPVRSIDLDQGESLHFDVQMAQDALAALFRSNASSGTTV